MNWSHHSVDTILDKFGSQTLNHSKLWIIKTNSKSTVFQIQLLQTLQNWQFSITFCNFTKFWIKPSKYGCNPQSAQHIVSPVKVDETQELMSFSIWEKWHIINTMRGKRPLATALLVTLCWKGIMNTLSTSLIKMLSDICWTQFWESKSPIVLPSICYDWAIMLLSPHILSGLFHIVGYISKSGESQIRV